MPKRYFMLTTVLLLGLLPLWLLWPNNNPAQAAQNDDRLVIKEANLTLMVPDTSTAVQTALNLAQSYSGYVLNQRQWETGDTNTYGELTFGVPAEQFEALLNALRTLGTVEDEQLSGQDVLATAVDLQSRLDNLTSNQTRMRTFLEQTRNTTETLAVHQRLVQVESEINHVQGQLNLYTGRSAAARITLHLSALVPTPTPTPLPTPQSWSPGNTARVATVRSQQNIQSVADTVIYFTIAWMPWLLLMGLGLWIFWQIQQRITPATPQRERVGQDSKTDEAA